jgi:hypothetical protein
MPPMMLERATLGRTVLQMALIEHASNEKAKSKIGLNFYLTPESRIR